jgi:hypothetical protein
VELGASHIKDEHSSGSSDVGRPAPAER